MIRQHGLGWHDLGLSLHDTQHRRLEQFRSSTLISDQQRSLHKPIVAVQKIDHVLEQLPGQRHFIESPAHDPQMKLLRLTIWKTGEPVRPPLRDKRCWGRQNAHHIQKRTRYVAKHGANHPRAGRCGEERAKGTCIFSKVERSAQ